MTVIVTLPDGGTVGYLRFGDAYVKHPDGSLDIIRSGAKYAYRYAAGEWADVEGDQKRLARRKRRFWGSGS